MVPQRWFLRAFLLFPLFQLCTSGDTLTPTQSITGGEILLSSGQNFALGFFSPGNSSNQYVGIWCHKIPEQTVVWVANRDNPIQDSPGALMINGYGNLVVLDGDRRTLLWSTNVSTSTNNTTAKLLDSGNLVLSSSPSGTLVWQSFDYPTHVWLPGMKLGLNLKTGMNWSLTSWKSRDDPARGDYSYGLDPRGSPQFFVFQGSAPLWRSGPWNGQEWSSVPLRKGSLRKDTLVSDGDEINCTYILLDSSIFSIMMLNESQLTTVGTRLDGNRGWNVMATKPQDACDNYGQCGKYGSCNVNNIVHCECLQGFEPKSPQDWNLREWSGGCVRKRRLECGKGEGFLKLEHVKLPDTSVSTKVDMSSSLEDCRKECLRNCSCAGYASAKISDRGSGCIAWYGDLMDIREIASGGQDFHLRVNAIELAQARSVSKGFLGKKRMVVILTVPLVVGVSFLVLCGCYVFKKRKTKGTTKKDQHHRRFLFDFTTMPVNFEVSLGAHELEDSRKNPELPLLELNVIVAATDNFSLSNKLGQGGFGSVYKGRLSNGQEIAVKRLSKNSRQGIEEFKTEVVLIAKLQHRNLVRLLGCCIQQEETMLIYEYMPNKSLDAIVFNQSRKALLDWRKRFEIIIGIARGILYLHEDSRLRIVHRDLKASNVLLDREMTPKISDFGIARIFGGNQSQETTNRVIGTYGYMAPEYAMEGKFSIKSDVFSFGVLLLEIISGKKNNDYFNEDPSLNLIGHAWNLWREDKAWDIVDSSISDLCPTHEVVRCIQVALLCVQESALDRPTISSVIFMLGNETTIPLPDRPAFVVGRLKIQNSSATNARSNSVNEEPITVVEGR